MASTSDRKIRYMCKRTTGKTVKVRVYRSQKDGLMHRRTSTGKPVSKKKKLYKTRAKALKACRKYQMKMQMKKQSSRDSSMFSLF